jgi:hypothetical protein
VANCVGDKKFRPPPRLSFRNLAAAVSVASLKGPTRPQEGTTQMRKLDLDHLLEAAVAKAIGVPLPRKLGRRVVPARKAHQPVRHAA